MAVKYQQLTDRAWLESKYIHAELSAAQIACLVGCEESNVTYWLRKHGIPTRDVNLHVKRYWSPEDNQILRELWERGDTSAKIGAKLGRTECAVRGQARALGLPHRLGRRKMFRRNGMPIKTTPIVSVLSPRGGNLDSSRLAYLISEGLVMRARGKAA